MRRLEFPAMGTQVVAIGEHPRRVIDFFARAEAVFSRFQATSDLSLLNQTEQHRVEVSPDLASCLEVAFELKERTEGLVDPAVGGLVVDWGYDRTFAEVCDRTAVAPAHEIGRWSIEGRTVIREPGVLLDLGGIAKGWTADAAVAAGLADLVSAGGDVRSQLPATTISIEDPWGEVATEVTLAGGGLATSSTARRRWRVGKKEVHHIIDPRRLEPATTPVFSATVAAATAAEAEAGAKAVLLQGERGLVWAEQQAWIDAALVVWHDGNVFATSGWDLAA